MRCAPGAGALGGENVLISLDRSQKTEDKFAPFVRDARKEPRVGRIRHMVAKLPPLSGGPVDAFAQNPAYTFGDSPRDFGSGPGTAQVDASVLKNFRLHERTTLQFRAEALNVLNHPNWANPNTIFGSLTFGQVTGLQAGNQSRIIQVALHLSF